MAGIGFPLRPSGGRLGLILPAVSLGRAAVIAAGPWIFTVLSIALIHQTTAHILSPQQSYDFRGHVIYAFALSLLATAPIVGVAVRQVADDIFLGTLEEVGGRFVAALTLSAATSATLAGIVLYGVFGVGGVDLAVGIVATTVVGLIWPTLALCATVRDYSGITLGFLLGLLASVVASVLAAHAGWSAAAMMAMFTLGLGIVFFGLAGRVLASFPRSAPALLPHVFDLLRGMARYRLLAIGSAVAIVALWIDKWIMWFGPYGVPLQNGLVSAPLYDGAMFVAYLVIIPALGLFITAIESTFLDRYRDYYDAIRERGTLARIGRARAKLERHSLRLLGRVLMAQAILCVVIVLAAPALVSAVGLQYQQVGILRLGAVAALFQFEFLACTSLLLFFGQHGRFLALQLLFLACQTIFTLATIRLGPQFYGYGHLVACAVAGYGAFAVLDRTFVKLDYLTFAAALRQSLAGEKPRMPRRRPEPRTRPAYALPETASGGGRARPLLAS